MTFTFANFLRAALIIALAASLTAAARSASAAVDPINKNIFGTALKGYDAVAYFKEGNMDSAISNYEEALKRNPSDMDTKYNLAMAKKQKKNNEGGGGSNQQQQKNKNQNQTGNYPIFK